MAITTMLNAKHNDTNNYDNKGRYDSQHFSSKLQCGFSFSVDKKIFNMKFRHSWKTNKICAEGCKEYKVVLDSRFFTLSFPY